MTTLATSHPTPATYHRPGTPRHLCPGTSTGSACCVCGSPAPALYLLALGNARRLAARLAAGYDRHLAPALATWPPAPLAAHWPLYAAGGTTMCLSRTTARHDLRAAGVRP